MTLITRALENGKAQDVSILDLDGKSDIASAMVIASGSSSRHVSALAERLEQTLKSAGYGRLAMEGKARGEWILLDIGDVIIHLFHPDARAFYNLEKLWGVGSPDADGRDGG